MKKSTLILLALSFFVIASTTNKNASKQNLSVAEIRAINGKEDVYIKHKDYSLLIYKEKNDAVFVKFNSNRYETTLKFPLWTVDYINSHKNYKDEIKYYEVYKISSAFHHYGLHHESKTLLEHFIQVYPNVAYLPYLHLSMLIVEQGSIEKGIKLYEDAIKSTNPTKTNTMRLNFPVLYLTAKMYDEAINYSLELLEEPNAFDPFKVNYNLACAYSLSGQHSKAFEALRIVAKNPESDPRKRHNQEDLISDPDFENIRNLPEFQKILETFPKSIEK